EHRAKGRAPHAALVPAGNDHERYVRHPGLQQLLEVRRGDNIRFVLGAGREPEGREYVVDGHPGDVCPRRVHELQAGTAEEHVDPDRRRPRLVARGHRARRRGEVPRQHAHGTVAGRVLQRDVGRAVAAFRVTGQPPGPARRLDAGDPGYRLGYVQGHEGHVLDAAWVVEALQPVLLTAVGIGHHQ